MNPNDRGEGARIARPQRKSRSTAALLEHSEAPALPSQQKHIDEFRAAEAVRQQTQPIPTDSQQTCIDGSRATTAANEVQIRQGAMSISSPRPPAVPPSLSPTPSALEKRPLSEGASPDREDLNLDTGREDARYNAKPKGKFFVSASYPLVAHLRYQQNEPAKLL
jgi:hypothetical protein